MVLRAVTGVFLFLTTGLTPVRPPRQTRVGTATIHITGHKLHVHGTYPTTRCAEPASANGQGVSFEASFRGGRFELIDEFNRTAGVQTFVTDVHHRGTLQARLTFSDGTTYSLNHAPGKAAISPDFRQVVFDLRMHARTDSAERHTVRVRGNFRCQP